MELCVIKTAQRTFLGKNWIWFSTGPHELKFWSVFCRQKGRDPEMEEKRDARCKG